MQYKFTGEDLSYTKRIKLDYIISVPSFQSLPDATIAAVLCLVNSGEGKSRYKCLISLLTFHI